jgi:hypothetical protein
VEWIRNHPYFALTGVAILLFIAGTIVVQQRLLVQPTSTTAWGGGTTLLNPTAYDPRNPLPSPRQQPTSGTNVNIPVIPRATSSLTLATQTNTNFDFGRLLGELSGLIRTPPPAPSVGGVTPIDPYAFIPTGLISTSSTKARTASQTALYEYGNQIGSFVQSFEASHTDMIQVLKGQAEDRTNKAKAEGVRRVGRDLSGIGEAILGLQEIPSQVRSGHTALGEAYVTAGKSLTAIASVQTDQEFLAAITAYNKAADVLNTRFGAIALIFSANNVRFSDQDSGTVFTFTQIGL